MKKFFLASPQLLSTISLFGLLLLALLLPASALAQQAYQPLTSIPFVDQGTGLAGLLNGFFILTIIAGALIAVVKISIAGFKWMMTDSITTKSDAKADITGALLGLAILLSTYVVLYQVNPNLVQLDVLKNARDNPAPMQTSTGSGVPLSKETQERLDSAVPRVEGENKQDATTIVAGEFGDKCKSTGATPFVYGKSAMCVEPKEAKLMTSYSSSEEAAAAAAACTAANGTGTFAPNGDRLYAATCTFAKIDQSVYAGSVGLDARTNCTNEGGIPSGPGLVNCDFLKTPWPPKN